MNPRTSGRMMTNSTIDCPLSRRMIDDAAVLMSLSNAGLEGSATRSWSPQPEVSISLGARDRGCDLADCRRECGAETRPGDDHQHADHDDGEHERVLDERLTVLAAHAREQLVNQGHPQPPSLLRGPFRPLVGGVVL